MQHANKTRGTGTLGGAGMVGLWGASSLIKSVQYVSIAWVTNGATSGTATIAAVDTAQSVCLPLSFTSPNNTANDVKSSFPKIVLTNGTTVTATIGGLTGSALTVTVNAVVVEYAPGVLKSVQTGSIAVASATSNTATITSVDTSKSVLIHNMMTSDDANTGVAFRPDQIQHRLALTNATTITATRGTAGTVTVTVPFTIMEYF